MQKIKIALIGLNTFSHSLAIFLALKKLNDIFDLVGYVFPENERERFPQKDIDLLNGYPELSLEEVMNDPEIEAVAIETEEMYLTKYAIIAAQHNKHIYMEKPGSQSLSQFETLVQTVKETKKAFSIGYMYRFNPEIKRLIERVKSGELGDIVCVEAQMNSNHDIPQREYFDNFKGGIMFFLGCHLVDMILLIMGKPERIIPLNKCSGKLGVNTTDFGMAVFEYKNGIAFAKSCSVERGGFARRQLVVTGTNGTVELKPLEMHSGTTTQHTGVTEYLDPNISWIGMGESRKSEYYDRYDDMLRAFAANVRGEGQYPFTPDYELELFKTILEACGE